MRLGSAVARWCSGQKVHGAARDGKIGGRKNASGEARAPLDFTPYLFCKVALRALTRESGAFRGAFTRAPLHFPRVVQRVFFCCLRGYCKRADLRRLLVSFSVSLSF